MTLDDPEKLLSLFGYKRFERREGNPLKSDPPRNLAEVALAGAVQDFLAGHLFWHCGWSLPEIGEYLGMTPGNVNQKLLKLRRRETGRTR